ncbi:hypothetical protein [Herbaspirillum rubrisubalbicans]|uniref:hypothetical protein n=1 Tax=Herbaspirillum rubrisubalbicans TaxID=80842 RepID=UPI0015EB2944|nr:hypothetical protein [Herbaspirillum rubrisubalbicans]
MDKVQLDLRPLMAYVNNAPGDRYPRAMQVMVQVFRVMKLNPEDKQDLLSDLSDFLDGIPPSERAGMTAKSR